MAMPHSPIPLTCDIVLVGGGHAHALLLRAWGMNPLPGARLTLLTPEPTAPYTGMLPGHIAGHYPRAALEIDLVRLARHAGARLILGRAQALDRESRMIGLTCGRQVAFDLASLDIGITSEMPELPGFAEHGAAAKPLGRYARRWQAHLDGLRAGCGIADAVVIGGGVAGVELALAMAHRLRAEGHGGASVTVIEAGPGALPHIGAGARAALMARMQALGVGLRTAARVARVGPHEVELTDGTALRAGFVLAAAGPRSQGWLQHTGLHLTDGYVTVDARLRSVTDPAIFAVGDCAHLRDSPRPKAGVYAVRQAPVLAANLRAAASGGRLRRYRAQRDYLKLVSTGGREAVADKWGLRLEGGWLWRLKDGIDARFMAGLRDLPVMAPPRLPRDVARGVRAELGNGQPLCTGCGAKVGAQALQAALAGLPEPARPDLLAGAGDDAAVLTHGAQRQVIATDHLRALCDDPWLMARIALVHALGDVWAMGARPQVALAQVTLPRMSAALQARWLAEITTAATSLLRAEGAELAGGHTTQGAEFTLGFTVTGLAARTLSKAGARPGDVLVLTKPLGTGTVLAAHMVHAAAGDDVAAAWASMAQPQGAAAAVLAPLAHAMTDVTGFGLAGHLGEMLAASGGVSARLELAALPLLPGAEALAAAGHRSTMAPANRGSAPVTGLVRGPRAQLIFDPQTSGGLLAALPAASAPAAVSALRAKGYCATAIVGHVTEGAGTITLAGDAAP